MWDSGKHWKITFIIAWGESGNIAVIWWQRETDAATGTIQAQRINAGLEWTVINHSYPYSDQSLSVKKRMDKIIAGGPHLELTVSAESGKIIIKKGCLNYSDLGNLLTWSLISWGVEGGVLGLVQLQKFWGKRENKNIWSHTKQVCHRTEFIRWKRHETLA